MFASDNFAPVHPEVFAALQKANVGHAIAYGADPWTKKAEELFKQVFGPEAESFIVFNGTAANVCAFKHLLTSWQAILCSQSAHIWNDECGAPQANTGCSLLPVIPQKGKISPDSCKALLHGKGFQHHVQPAAISITQSTELGTVYSIDELKALAHFAKQNDLLFHIDGARLCNAAAHLAVPLKAITTDIGADVVSFGGTKNGLMGAEAIVFLKKGLANQFPYVRKQQMQLASKMRFLSAQMVALLEKDLWLRNATHANKMAKFLEAELKKQCPHLSILYPVQANAVFVKFPSMDLLQEVQKSHFFWVWDSEQAVARWMTSWDTEPATIEQFVSAIKRQEH